ncbi:glutaminyl-peptide cyclotransferase [Coniochaeta sp. 2T2.1]|nr:glutaminyl-peptide cyclotransferase [Coniochaeta sp. 2T2.1]
MFVARAVDAALSRKWEGGGRGGGGDDGLEDEEGENVGVQILFLDGEEAWVSWSESDSIYGARALAETWSSTSHAPDSLFPTPLSSISLFLLLDLLGDADPRVPSYFRNTHWAYQHLSDVEERMRKLGLLETTPKTPFLPEKDKKANQFTFGFIGDDHVPFLKRGVDVLHVIPTPFPSFWHTMEDDAQHLDLPTVRDWGRIVSGFVAEWMELDGEVEVLGRAWKREKDEL